MRSVDEDLAGIAAGQHGVITRRQLLAAGVGATAVKRRVAKGTLQPVHRGVYRLGHRAPSTKASYLAAVLACGEGAVLSGLAAAHLFGLVRGAEQAPEVSAPGHRRIEGIQSRRVNLDRRDVSVYRGIPVTTVPRTLVDVGARLGAEELARASHQADVLHGVGVGAVEAALARKPNAPGAAKLRSVLRGDTPLLLSWMEKAFLTQLRRARLPLPRTNRKKDGHFVDCRWPDRSLTVELDSYRYHRTRHAWELDRLREREARARGDEFRRFTYDDVTKHQRQLLDELRALLAA